MKTLAALKREAKNFTWSMLNTNSFYMTNGIPDFLKAYRKVTKVQSDRMAFKTLKEGIASESWVNFPKAKQVEITEDAISERKSYFVKFTQDSGTFVLYHLLEEI